MVVATATCSPSSLQLRFALGSTGLRRSPAFLARRRIWKQNRRLRYGIIIPERRRAEVLSFSIRSESKADGFAGWSGTDAEEGSLGSEERKWLGGPVGAGVAGIVLAAGLTFAALSLGKRSNYGTKHMEPLRPQQEESLLADDKTNEVGGHEDEGQRTKQEDASSQEDGTGTYTDSSSFSEVVDVPSENRVDDDSVSGGLSVHDIKDTSPNSDAIDNIPIQEELQHESTFDDKSVEAVTVPSPNNLLEPEEGSFSSVSSEFKDLDSNTAVTAAEIISELKENPINVGSTNLSSSDTIPSNISLDYKDEIPVSDEPVALDVPYSHSNTILETHIASNYSIEKVAVSSTNENFELGDISQVSVDENSLTLEMHRVSEAGPSGTSVYESANLLQNEQFSKSHNQINRSTSESPKPGTSFSSAGIPAPSVVFSALQVLPGKVLVPAVVDQVQGQALAALQVLKVIEAEVQPGDLCTRREYARWLVSASSVLSRNTTSKVYPAMYIEHVTELAFDDITPEDPDFVSIQGLAEAGLISSKLSKRDMLSSVDEDQEPFFFSPESPLSHQDLVSWKMTLEKRHLPEADRKVLYELSGFIDTDKIHPDACPALVADLSAGEQGIIALAFGYTRLFQPDKPVTKAQAAIALATGEAFDAVGEELARIEAESIAENAVAAHTALVAQVEKDINASYEKELSMEREKIDAVEKMAAEAMQELEKLRAEREENNIALMKERMAIESELEVLSRLRREVEEQLQGLMSNKVEVSYEKERIGKLRKEAEDESREIERLQYELEVERKALSMARAWAEDEARRAREQAKSLEEARDRWERHGIKVVVDDDLREESLAGVTWVDASKQFSVDETVSRAESLTDKLKAMSADVTEKSRATIDRIIQKITMLISSLKEWASAAGKRAEVLRDTAISKVSESTQNLQRDTLEFSSVIKEGAKRVVGDCREGVEKLTQKFVKT